MPKQIAPGYWETDLFTRGESHPDHTVRIPSLLVTREATVLAICEARNVTSHGGGDHASNDLLLKRSTDHGRSWSDVSILATAGRDSLNNPTVVQDRDTGRIFLFYQRYPDGYHGAPDPRHDLQGVEPGYGHLSCRTLLITSDDDGLTWSEPRDLTRQAKAPEMTAAVAGPGIGIQLRRGPHSGRLVIPFYKMPDNPYQAYTVYSDDHGDTWTRGELNPIGNEGAPNEHQVVELTDGRIMLNSRRSGPGPKGRKLSFSEDGGHSWSPLEDDPALPDQGCQGTIIRYSDPLDGEPNRLLFCNPNDTRKRINGTLRLSHDDGATWPVSKPVGTAPFFVYSCLQRLGDDAIGLLYERTHDDTAPITIAFARLSLDWLTQSS